MKKLSLLLLLFALPAVASPTWLGTLVATSGASTNNFATTNITTAGTTGAITLAATPQKPIKLYIQCDASVRIKAGTGNTLTVANTGANKGSIKLDADQLMPFTLTSNALAIIPSTGAGNANCDLSVVPE